MDMPLTITTVMRHAEMYHGEREIVSAVSESEIRRANYSDVFRRARKLFNALQALDCQPGDRIATLAWNNQQHLELYYGVICGGYVLHTINPRLFDDQIAYIINHADDKWIVTDQDFVPLLERLAPQLKKVKGIVILNPNGGSPETTLTNVHSYEQLLAGQNDNCTWPDLDETSACAMCYTSGTTGNPKGVLYSHRSLLLHTLSVSLLDADGLSINDIIMPVVPMFHVNAWGLPFRAPLAGASIVFPDRYMGNPRVLSNLIAREEVTYAVSVPTIWQMLLDHLDQSNGNLKSLRKAVVGGGACPLSLFRRFKEDYGVELAQGWGMTELCSAGTLNIPGPGFDLLNDEERKQYSLKQGRPIFGLQVKITDDEDNALPWDSASAGHLKVKGPTVCSDYFRSTEAEAAVDAAGWFMTGDVATIDPDGTIQVTDRSKDLIKSGGEWISSIDLENCAMTHPAIVEAAVVGAVHEKWNERPLLIAVKKPNLTVSKDDMLAWFDGKVASWWKPDAVIFVEQLPHTATGKVSKLSLREQYGHFLITDKPFDMPG